MPLLTLSGFDPVPDSCITANVAGDITLTHVSRLITTHPRLEAMRNDQLELVAARWNDRILIWDTSVLQYRDDRNIRLWMGFVKCGGRSELSHDSGKIIGNKPHSP
ncbi:MAG: hypothetical protein KJ904_18645 [Alphaproteobacteria bacterium]|nr:hypothetical protein [Alphaproteobacteria bacterium]MBU0796303.1 hypothetical protein [Alphaproteobacteria bacterium]MBU0889180.1 hypothetical protein [Alphaproteobacteria bacterium]MBU1812214.1 hypothetical protein [Alphaproteobacteria bacterium]MBU2091798.1 hypothetical protein [Alphaproteobacteria bacterium]